MSLVYADPDKARELLRCRLDRAATEGLDVDHHDYDALDDEPMTIERAEEVRAGAVADVQDVLTAYGRPFVEAIARGQVIR